MNIFIKQFSNLLIILILFPKISYCIDCEEYPDHCLSCVNKKCEQCESHYYINGYACSKCGDNCKECQDIYYACTECKNGYYLFPDGFYSKCKKCEDDLCEQCDGTPSYHCTECKPGYYINNEDGKCAKCHDSCLKCDGPLETQCTVCNDGYYNISQSENVFLCASCPQSNCKVCHGIEANDCDECKDGFYKSGNLCRQCETECATCKDIRNNCLSCIDGYYLEGTNCLKCTDNCKKCTGPDKYDCTECKENYVREYGCVSCYEYTRYACTKCFKDSNSITRCTECAEGYKPNFYDNDGDDSTFNCDPCSYGCASCPEATYICERCLPGFYLDSNNDYCQNCESPCLTCHDSATTCDSCVERFYFDNEINECRDCSDHCVKCKSSEECNVCEEKFYPLNGKCTPCDESCHICHDNTNACDECEESYHFNQLNQCVKCPENCKQCNDTHCISCADNFYPVGNECKPCHEKCLHCNGPTADDCLNCDPGYYYSDGACFKCDESCETCRGPTSSDCDYNSCSLGYYYNKNTYKCFKCEHNCKNCTGQFSCVECNEGFRLYVREGDDLDDKDCQPCKNRGCKRCDAGVDKCTECIDGFYPSEKDENQFITCSRCPSNCNECSLIDSRLTCTKCTDGFYLRNGICEKCSFPCSRCTDENTCQACLDGFLFDSSTSTCNTKCSDNCLSCEDTADTCTSCANGFVLSGTKCKQCNEGCRTCNFYDLRCTSCLDGYYSYYNYNWQMECAKCSDNCETCIDETSSGCTSCKPGFYFSVSYMSSDQFHAECTRCNENSPNCESCIENCNDNTNECSEIPICTKCADGSYLTENDECSLCDESCATCDGPGAEECITCKEGLFLYNNKCSQCSESCLSCSGDPENCTSCKSGQYLLNGKCNSCDTSTCIECKDDASYCTKCTNDYYAYEGKCYASCYDFVEYPVGGNPQTRECYKCNLLDNCIEYDDGCQCMKCEEGYFIVTDEVTRIEFCLPCQLENCKVCNGAEKNDCIECSPGYYLYTNPNTGSKECKPCEGGCTQCSSQTICSECYDSFFLNSKSECEKCHEPCVNKCGGSDGSICFECDNGYYHLENNTCDNCDESCASCFGSTRDECNSCSPGYTKVGTSCTKCNFPCLTCSETNGSLCLSCASGFYLDEPTCALCSSSCRTCEESPEKCTSCFEGFYLSSSTCLKCAEGCATCNESPEKCMSCIVGYHLENDSCKQCSAGCVSCFGSVTNCSSCIQGYYHKNDNTCHQCEFPCASCFGPSNETCLSCAKRYVLNGSVCQLAPDDCELNKHCEKDNSDGKEYLNYTIDLPVFESYTNEESGGAVRLINYGFSGEDATFNNCVSEKGGGGGIYIFNDIQNSQSTYSVNLRNLTFQSCKGFFGAAVYIYSPSEESPVIIDDCKFIKNQIYLEPSSNTISGGSAIYLTVKNGKVSNCQFKNNNGPGGIIKVNKKFDMKPQSFDGSNNTRTDGLLEIKGCTFEGDDGDDCSLFFGGKLLGNIEVSECHFSGKLIKGTHFIDGKIDDEEKSHIFVKSCKFESDEKRAVNMNLIHGDMKNQLVMVNKFAKNEVHLNFWLSISAVAIAASAIITIIALIRRLDNEETSNNNDRSIEA